MKTNNIYSKIKLLVAVISLVLISGNVYSQKSYKQSDFSRLFTNIKERVRLVPVKSNESKNLMLASPEVLSEESDDQIIEDWMLDDSYFDNCPLICSEDNLYTEEDEEDVKIENWMLDENYFEAPISQNIKPKKQ